MNADMILVATSEPNVVTEAIARIGPLLREEKAPLPLPEFPSRPDIRRSAKRTLLLLHSTTGWTAVTEGGEVADEYLARALSKELEAECVMVGLYDTANAWARRHYRAGVVTQELFQPPGAFSDGFDDEDWPGDAQQECLSWLRDTGWSYGFPLFSELIRGGLPSGGAAVARVVLAP
jgi:hypothetical protein